MGLPEGSFAVAAFIVLALPGLIYAAIRRGLNGSRPEDRDVAQSIVRSAVFAIVLTCVYALLFAGMLVGGLAPGSETDTVIITDLRAVALTVLVFYALVPAVLAALLHLHHITWVQPGAVKWLRIPRSKHGYTSTPNAWEHAVRRNPHSWVKIRRASGQWIGGWYSGGSFATSFPEPESIYIHEQYEMTAGGNFGKPIPNTGVHVAIGEGDIVIWVRTSLPTEESDQTHERPAAQ